MTIKLHVHLEHYISSSRKDAISISKLWRGCCWIEDCWRYAGGGIGCLLWWESVCLDMDSPWRFLPGPCETWWLRGVRAGREQGQRRHSVCWCIGLHAGVGWEMFTDRLMRGERHTYWYFINICICIIHTHALKPMIFQFLKLMLLLKNSTQFSLATTNLSQYRCITWRACDLAVAWKPNTDATGDGNTVGHVLHSQCVQRAVGYRVRNARPWLLGQAEWMWWGSRDRAHSSSSCSALCFSWRNEVQQSKVYRGRGMVIATTQHNTPVSATTEGSCAVSVMTRIPGIPMATGNRKTPLDSQLQRGSACVWFCSVFQSSFPHSARHIANNVNICWMH